LSAERIEKAFGHHSDAILLPFAVTYDDLSRFEIQVFDAQPTAFENTQPRSVHQRSHERGGPRHAVEDGVDFAARQHQWQTGWAFSARKLQLVELAAQNVAVQEQERRKRLALGRGTDFASGRQVRHECGNLGFAHAVWVAFVEKEDKAFDPGNVGFFGAGAVVPRANLVPNSVKESRSGRDLVERLRLGGR
jgi:hypothetical protein